MCTTDGQIFYNYFLVGFFQFYIKLFELNHKCIDALEEKFRC